MLISENTMDVFTEHLRTFLKVCELKSFTKAAQRLRKTQSTISTQVAVLEQDTGLKLLDRSQRPVHLTEAGEIFSSLARQIVNSTDQLGRSIRELAEGVAGEVKIATTTSIGAFILPKIVGRLLQEMPRVRLDITIKSLSSVCESVKQAETDFGIILSQRNPPVLNAKSLKRERLCFVVSPRHPLARRTVRLEELRSHSFVVGARTGGYTEMIQRLLERNGLFGFEVALRVGSFEAIKEAVRSGLGIGVLPEFMVQREIRSGVLAEISTKKTISSVNITLIERPNYTPTPTVESVRGFIQKMLTS
jgi:LysR family transcriptional regulator, transcriptional activator of the cysJI operon